MVNKVTSQNYWETIYNGSVKYKSPVVHGYLGFINNQVTKSINRFYPYKSIVELGAGGSDWLIHLALASKSEKVQGIEYTIKGCELLEKKAAGVIKNLKVLKKDIFELNNDEIEKFELVFSNGLVEHFKDLEGVIGIKKRFMAEDGYMYTIIPNIPGLPGLLMRYLNKDIYDLHVPYNHEKLRDAHEKNGLYIVDSGYLCFFNYGVASACIDGASRFVVIMYKLLAIIGRLQLIFEFYIKKLPANKFSSPYIFVLAKYKR